MSASTITARPNNVGSVANLSILGSPSPNTQTRAISDDTDSTGLQKTVAGNTATFRATISPPSYATKDPVWYSLTPRVRVTGAGTLTVTLVDARTNLPFGGSDTIVTAAGTATYTGAARAVSPSGGALTTGDVSNVMVQVDYAGSGTPQVIEVYLDSSVNQAPTVTISGPTGTLRDSLRPNVVYNYSDPESDTQERIRLKVVTTAVGNQISAGAIDADSAPTVFDSGEVFTSSSPYKVTSDLPAGGYFLLIKAADQGSNGRYGYYSSSALTITPDVAAQPTVVPTVDDANGRVTLAVRAYDNELTYGQSSFESGIVLNAASWNATNATLAANTTTFLSGGESLQATYSSVQTPTIRSHTATGTSYAPPAVVPGLLYLGRVSVRANAGSTARPWTPALEWLNAAGTVIAVSTGPDVTDSTSAWNEMLVAGIAPVGAVQVILRLTSTQPSATEVHLFDQASVAPVPQLVPLAAASFEDGTTGGWVSVGGPVTVTNTTPAVTPPAGSKALLVTLTGGSGWFVGGPVGTTPVTPGRVHVAQASALWVTGATPRQIQMFIRYRNNAGSQTDTAPVTVQSSATAWTAITVTGVAPPGAVSAQLVIQPSSAAINEAFAVDAAYLSELTNLLTPDQSSFELSNGGWAALAGVNAPTSVTAASIGLTAVDGTNVLRAQNNAAVALRWGTTSNASLGTAVTAGRTYMATAAVGHTIAANTRTMFLTLRWFNAANTEIGHNDGSNVSAVATGWTTATVTATAPAGAVRVIVEVQVASSGSPVESYVTDAVQLVDTTAAPTWVHGYDAWTRGGMVAGVNLLTANTAGIESDASSWTAGTNTTLLKKVDAAPEGSAALLFSTSVGGTNTTATSPLVPVTAGVLYTAGAMFTTGSARSASVTIQWFKSDGTASAVRASDASPTSALSIYSLYRQLIVSAVAPSDAAYANVKLTMFNIGTTDTINYADAVFLHAGNSEVFRAGGAATPVQYIVIERSIDGGSTWSTVRAGSAVRLTYPGQTATVQDYDAPRDTTAIYRARTVGGTVPITNGSTNPDFSTGADWNAAVISANEQAAGVAMSALCDLAWLKSSTDPTKNIQVRLLKDSANSTSTEDQAVFEPQGRTTPIVHGGTVRGEVFEGLQFVFLNDAAYDAFETLRARQEPVLLQTPFGDAAQDQFWVRLGPTRSVIRYTSDGMATAQIRRIVVAAREVAAPTS